MILFFNEVYVKFSLQMLVIAPLFQIAAFIVQFLALPFPAFALSYSVGGIGLVFQVGIISP
jgi:hypothetical protein